MLGEKFERPQVYVTGHKNPDSDSVCAALAYAYLLNELKRYHAIPIRLGALSPETKFILNYFGVEPPLLMTNVKPRVKDLIIEEVPLFRRGVSLKKAWKEMTLSNIKTAIVVDRNRRLVGVVSSTTIVDGYMEHWGNDVLAKSKTPIANIMDTIEAQPIYVVDPNQVVTGKMRIIAMDGETMMRYIEKGDIVVVGGGRDRVYAELIEKQVGMIILSGGYRIDDDLVEEAKLNGVSIITTELDTYLVSRYIIQSIPLKYMMKRDNLLSVTNEDLIEDVKKTMASNRYRSFPVLERNTNRVLGMISRYNLVEDVKKKIIQVDHNERSQSVAGIEEAEIVEIIDHHRVADVQTSSPVYFRNEPLGSTSTIISKIYFENGVTPPKKYAGILMAAIISDTLLFKSPTCTPIDKEIALKLANIAGVDVEKFAHDMFTAGTSLIGRTVQNIFNTDFKTFTVEDRKVGIAQVNTMDIEGFMPLKEEMKAYMDEMILKMNYDLLVLLLTDVIEGGSYVVTAGKLSFVVKKAFDETLEGDMLFIPGVVSRKKQMLPSVIRVITTLE